MIVKGPEEVGGKVCSKTARSKWDNYEHHILELGSLYCRLVLVPKCMISAIWTVYILTMSYLFKLTQ